MSDNQLWKKHSKERRCGGKFYSNIKMLSKNPFCVVKNRNENHLLNIFPI